MELVDICFNLTSSALRNDEAEGIERAHQVGVNHFILTGSNVPDSEYAIQLSTKYDGMVATAGVHPHHASQYTEEVGDKLTSLCQFPAVVAVGECGLDFFRNFYVFLSFFQAFLIITDLSHKYNLDIYKLLIIV